MPPSTIPPDRRYCLITPCRNEEAYARIAIESIARQSLPPSRWIIVDDGSTDTTPEILAEYARQLPYLKVVRRTDRGYRQLGGGVIDAFYEGYRTIDPRQFDYLGKVDLDLDLPPKYFELLVGRMEQNRRIGTCSGQAYFPAAGGKLVSEKCGPENSLGMTKFYRTACFEEIGGFIRALMWDAIDCHRARMLGWIAVRFDEPDLRFVHLRPMGTSDRSWWTGRARHGAGQYFMGTGPTYLLASALYRMTRPPRVVGGLGMLWGYLRSAIRRETGYDDPEFVRFLRRFQRDCLLRGKPKALERINRRQARVWFETHPNCGGLLPAPRRQVRSALEKTRLFCPERIQAMPPRVSFGIPVRNAQEFLPQALESILAQDFGDFEIVVCDNASTDGTGEVGREFAKRDSRIRYVRNEEDIGQIENFNRVFRLSRGKYFRWMGADDWLEPSYTSKCVAALESNPAAIGITTLWRRVDDDGNVDYRELRGDRAESPKLWRRFFRCLWLLQADPLYFDPIYGMLRRDVLERTELLTISRWTDRLLAVDLVLAGPFGHVQECLAGRRNAREDAAILLSRYHRNYAKGRNGATPSRVGRPWTMYASIAGRVWKNPINLRWKIVLAPAVFWYWCYHVWQRGWRRIKGAVHRRMFRPGRKRNVTTFPPVRT